MQKFIMINSTNNNLINQIANFFKVESIKFGFDVTIIYISNITIEDVILTLKALYIDLLLQNKIYISGSKGDLDGEERLVYKYLDKLDNTLNLAPDLIKVIENKNEGLKIVLANYYNDHNFKELLNSYFNNNLNVSLTANDIYLHRNTMLYKINNFYEHTGFNLKDFKDCAILYTYLN